VNLKTLFCWHKWNPPELIVEGATLSWAATPTRQYKKLYECEKCGKVKYDKGYVISEDRRIYPEVYNERGWPIDKDGVELSIAE